LDNIINHQFWYFFASVCAMDRSGQKR